MPKINVKPLDRASSPVTLSISEAPKVDISRSEMSRPAIASSPIDLTKVSSTLSEINGKIVNSGVDASGKIQDIKLSEADNDLLIRIHRLSQDIIDKRSEYGLRKQLDSFRAFKPAENRRQDVERIIAALSDALSDDFAPVQSKPVQMNLINKDGDQAIIKERDTEFIGFEPAPAREQAQVQLDLFKTESSSPVDRQTRSMFTQMPERQLVSSPAKPEMPQFQPGRTEMPRIETSSPVIHKARGENHITAILRAWNSVPRRMRLDLKERNISNALKKGGKAQLFYAGEGDMPQAVLLAIQPKPKETFFNLWAVETDPDVKGKGYGRDLVREFVRTYGEKYSIGTMLNYQGDRSGAQKEWENFFEEQGFRPLGGEGYFFRKPQPVSSPVEQLSAVEENVQRTAVVSSPVAATDISKSMGAMSRVKENMNRMFDRVNEQLRKWRGQNVQSNAGRAEVMAALGTGSKATEAVYSKSLFSKFIDGAKALFGIFSPEDKDRVVNPETPGIADKAVPLVVPRARAATPDVTTTPGPGVLKPFAPAPIVPVPAPASSPILVPVSLPMLLVQLENGLSLAFTNNNLRNDPFAGKSYAKAGAAATNAIPGESPFAPSATKQQFPAAGPITSPGLAQLPVGEPLPEPSGSGDPSGKGKAPTSMVAMVRAQSPLAKDLNKALRLAKKSLEKGFEKAHVLSIKTRMNYTSSGLSPTAWMLPLISAMSQAVQNAISAEAVIITIAAIVVLFGVVKLFNSKHFGALESKNVTAGLGGVSRAETEAPGTGNGTSERSKAVNAVTYLGSLGAGIVKAVTDRSALIAILEKVDQIVREVLRRFSYYAAKTAELAGKATNRDTQDASPVLGIASSPVTLGSISSGSGRKTGAVREASSTIKAIQRIINALGRVLGVSGKTAKSDAIGVQAGAVDARTSLIEALRSGNSSDNEAVSSDTRDGIIPGTVKWLRSE